MSEFDNSRRFYEAKVAPVIREFYSNILDIDCDTRNCRLSEEDWRSLATGFDPYLERYVDEILK